MTKSAALALVLTCGTCAIANEEPCTPDLSSSQCTLLLNGKFLMHSVDDRRVFLAIDTTYPLALSDGRLDHLILLTYTRGDVPVDILAGVLQKPLVGSVVLDPTAKTLEVKTRDGRRISLSLVDV